MYYLKYKIENTSPIRIADDSAAQKGQTETMHYIAGSAVRGFIIHQLGDAELGENKKKLFEEVRFLNAYPCTDDEELIPSLKGFYEDKKEIDTKKPLQTVLKDGQDIEGLKRARIGEFCSISEKTIRYYSVKTGSDLKIRMDQDQMFRLEYIETGHTFAGAIASEDQKMLERFKSILSGEVFLGNARSMGLGRCKVISAEISETRPYNNYAETGEINREGYLMLLSPLTMRGEYGEYSGINTEKLAELLGIQNLRISFCATSTISVQGYNRTWGGRTPSVMMYDKGSLFHLSFDGTISAEKMEAVMDKGIGVRCAEGFGRVIFLRNFEAIDAKEKGSEICVPKQEGSGERTDKEVLRIAAKAYYKELLRKAMDRYIVENPLKKGELSSSKLRNLEPILAMNRFQFKVAVRLLEEFFGHDEEKERKQRVHQELRSMRTIRDHVMAVLDGNLEELLSLSTKRKDTVMSIEKKGLLTDNEIGELKIEFLLKEIRYDGRKGGAE